MQLMISIFLLLISFYLIGYSLYQLKHIHTENIEIDKKNQELEGINKELIIKKNDLDNEINNKEKDLYNYQNQLTTIQNNISSTLDNQKELSQKAFENYCEVLENQYKETEEEYKMYKDAMETSYSLLQLKLLQEAEAAKKDLEQIQATRAAAIEAQRREKEIKEKLSFYCLKISNNELKDISVLESIKPKLHNERILSMLIWQTFFRKPMTDLCNNVIGTVTKSGIYKITNQNTNECYIGQAVDLATRWKDHAKCGLGIDTPPANKLYKAIQEYGIWNFSWEVLEECSKDQLDEKEKYYINLYKSKDFGYNSTKGNK